MLYTENRQTEIQLLKKMWRAEPVLCPKCGEAELVHLHKKRKKSNDDWQCPACGEIYRTIRMFMELPDR